MPFKVYHWGFALFILLLGCGGLDRLVVVVPAHPTEVVEPQPPPPTATPQPPPIPTPTPVAVAEASSTQVPQNVEPISESGFFRPLTNPETNKPNRHGLIWAFLLPVLGLSIPSIIIEIFVVRYVQPRGIDLSEVLVKTRDGFFIGTTLSMTARRTLTLASTRMSWPRVCEFMEKEVEQELIQRASELNTLEDFELNLKDITDSFVELPIVNELVHDFGVDVLRFNAEIRYPPETITALNERAEAAAGGAAYLAYAAAAHLDPESAECRELYRIYQQTTSRVDAARNLGSGISNLSHILQPRSAPSVNDGNADA